MGKGVRGGERKGGSQLSYPSWHEALSWGRGHQAKHCRQSVQSWTLWENKSPCQTILPFKAGLPNPSSFPAVPINSHPPSPRHAESPSSATWMPPKALYSSNPPIAWGGISVTVANSLQFGALLFHCKEVSSLAEGTTDPSVNPFWSQPAQLMEENQISYDQSTCGYIFLKPKTRCENSGPGISRELCLGCQTWGSSSQLPMPNNICI